MWHIAHLYETLKNYNTHIAVTGYTEVEESNISLRNDDLDSSFITSVMEADEAINESVKLNGDFASHAWGKIYDKKCFLFWFFRKESRSKINMLLTKCFITPEMSHMNQQMIICIR